MFSTFVYGLPTIYYGETWARTLDAMHIRCIRRALGIRSTYAAKLMGEEPVTDRHIAQLTKVTPMINDIQLQRYRLLGHALRREVTDPSRSTTYNKFGQPKAHSGRRRWGRSREAWADHVLKEAASEMQTQGLLRSARDLAGREYRQIAAIAQNRGDWGKVGFRMV